MAVFMGGGVSTMEPWPLGMVGWVGGGINAPQNKRFLPSLHDDRTMLPCRTVLVNEKNNLKIIARNS